MRYLPFLLILVACATNDQRSERAIYLLEREPERIENFRVYRSWCSDNGIMLTVNPYRRCVRKGCIPHRLDWDFYYRDDIRQNYARWYPKPGNTVRCVGRGR